MNLKKYHKKGLTGLSNLGNTCFLNSSLQVLNHTYELNDILDSSKCQEKIKKDLQDSDILNEWNDLRNVMWSGNGVVTPRKFVHNVHQIATVKGKDLFTGWAQNDMPEFLLFIMDCMHNSISRGLKVKVNGNTENDTDEIAVQCYRMLQTVYSTEYSEIMELFYGIYLSEILSKEGETRHVLKPENYFMLDLPIIQPSGSVATNLYECFDTFTQPEIMDGDNAWLNEATGERIETQKRMSFWNFPKVLVIALKRFSPDGSHKVENLIDFPMENLDLSKYVRGYNAESYKYDLYGVCNHMGGVMGGHYTSYVKNAEGQWIHYNDGSVEIVPNPQMVISPMAYCLFYRKHGNLA